MDNKENSTGLTGTFTSTKNLLTRGPKVWPALVLIAVGALVYFNSFKGQFVFDDHNSLKASARPVIELSLALNQAISGMDVWSYHLFNLTVHILAALILFGVIRRALLCDKL